MGPNIGEIEPILALPLKPNLNQDIVMLLIKENKKLQMKVDELEEEIGQHSKYITKAYDLMVKLSDSIKNNSNAIKMLTIKNSF